MTETRDKIPTLTQSYSSTLRLYLPAFVPDPLEEANDDTPSGRQEAQAYKAYDPCPAKLAPLPRLRLLLPDGYFWSIPYNELLESPGHNMELRLETLRFTFLLQGRNLTDNTFLDALDRHGIHCVRMINPLRPPTLAARDICFSSIEAVEKQKKAKEAVPTEGTPEQAAQDQKLLKALRAFAKIMGTTNRKHTPSEKETPL